MILVQPAWEALPLYITGFYVDDSFEFALNRVIVWSTMFATLRRKSKMRNNTSDPDIPPLISISSPQNGGRLHGASYPYG